MGGNDLKKAEKMYRRGKYSQVLQLLEAQIFRYRQSYRFYYILGMSCLHTGDYSGAASYLQRALSIKAENIPALLGMAVVHLKQQKTSEALKDWFQVIDQDPKNRYAQKGMNALRKYSDPDSLIDFTEGRQILKLIPREKAINPILFAGIGLAAVIGLSVLFYPAWKQFIPDFRSQESRPEIDRLDLQIDQYENEENLSSSEIRYELSTREIQETYETVLHYFHTYRDNLAQREINRLKHSNASKEVKQKMLLLEGYVREPSFDSFTDNFEYNKVQKDPVLYANCHVMWKGKVSNLEVDSDAIRFDLLVGYETGKVLEGIVPVRLDFAGKIDPAFPIEVLGRIELQGEDIELRAVSIHQFVQEEEES